MFGLRACLLLVLPHRFVRAAWPLLLRSIMRVLAFLSSLSYMRLAVRFFCIVPLYSLLYNLFAR